MKFSQKTFKTLIVILVIVVVIFILNIFSKNVRNFFYSVSAPIQKPLWKIGNSVSDFLGVIPWIKNSKQEFEELKNENQELLVKIAELEGFKDDIESLKNALQIGLEKDFKLVMAEIISKDISDDYILIDKGSNSGVLENMPVITEQKVILGKISKVFKNYSKVMLISNKESSFDVNLFNINDEKKDISGIVKGRENFNIFLDLVPRDKDIKQGDVIFTSKLGGIFPENLLVGEITEIKKNDIESLQEAEIKPAIDIKEVNNLFIITQY
ncbi:MAG: rod shape-determining protein MreC [Candidatus Nealsonbacteria bacterium]